MPVLLDSVTAALVNPPFKGLADFQDNSIAHRCIPAPTNGGPTYQQAIRIYPVNKAGVAIPNQGDRSLHVVAMPETELTNLLRSTMEIQAYLSGQWVTLYPFTVSALGAAGYVSGEVTPCVFSAWAISGGARRIPAGAPFRLVVWSTYATEAAFLAASPKSYRLQADLWASESLGRSPEGAFPRSPADPDSLSGLRYFTAEEIPVLFP